MKEKQNVIVTLQDSTTATTAITSSFSSLIIRLSGLFPFRINPEIMKTVVGRTFWTRDKLCRKAATYAGQHKHRRNAERYRCLEWDSNPRFQCLSGRRYTMPCIQDSLKNELTSKSVMYHSQSELLIESLKKQ
jgi:hypothetical protein